MGRNIGHRGAGGGRGKAAGGYQEQQTSSSCCIWVWMRWKFIQTSPPLLNDVLPPAQTSRAGGRLPCQWLQAQHSSRHNTNEQEQQSRPPGRLYYSCSNTIQHYTAALSPPAALEAPSWMPTPATGKQPTLPLGHMGTASPASHPILLVQLRKQPMPHPAPPSPRRSALACPGPPMLWVLTSDVGYCVGWCCASRSSFSMCISVVLPALSRPRNRILAFLFAAAVERLAGSWGRRTLGL